MKCMTTKCENETDNEIDFNGNRLVFCDGCIDDLNYRIGINYADFLVRRHLSAHAADAEKLCKICGQGPEVDHNGCIIIGMHR